MTLSTTGSGLRRVVYPFILDTSGPSVFKARFTSAVVTLLLRMRFMRMTDFRSSRVGAPRACSMHVASCLQPLLAPVAGDLGIGDPQPH